MFYNIGSVQHAIEKLEGAQDNQEFQSAISILMEHMKKIGMESQYLINLEKRAYYLPNEYSDKDTKTRMLEAKKRVIQYIDEIMSVDEKSGLLQDVLENFYLFLENLIERKPHKKGGIHTEQLESLRIKNEYDIQHFLYAYLKPLYPLARNEVNEDTGYNTVRTDIWIDSENTIKEKIIENPVIFKKTYEEKMIGKQIHIIIHQPKIL